MLKRIIPSDTRLRLRVLQIKCRDLVSGQHKLLVKQKTAQVSFPSRIQLSQPIRYNPYSDNKVHNLKLATAKLAHRQIPAGRIFSFWQFIPKPSRSNGFKKGRNLIGNGLALDYGGGLCQLSGILYHLCLLAGLKIIERHPHSKDIYTEATRYTPLGSDATVVYGHKDLRIQNTLDQAFSFSFEISSSEIAAHICTAQTIDRREVVFEAIDQGRFNLAKVSYRKANELYLISEDRYEKLM